jgi:hypothetical protein
MTKDIQKAIQGFISAVLAGNLGFCMTKLL